MYINLQDRKVRVEDIISNMIPDFILEENPLFLEFLKSYFKSREAFGSDIDLIRNLLEYQRIERLFGIKDSTTLSSDITSFATTITVDSTESFPEKYGLLQIDDEIISYEYKSSTQFFNCYRGFSGATTLGKYTEDNTYTFTQSNSATHSASSTVKNLGVLFLKEFLFHLKSKYLPGFEDIDFYEGVNLNLVLPKIKDFYSSKGTFNSFEILFRILYGDDPIVKLPKDNVVSPSNSEYISAFDMVVEVISGNIDNIKGSRIFQIANSNLGTGDAEGSIYDINFLKTVNTPERFFTSTSCSQSGNIITIESADHSLVNGDSVFINFSGSGTISNSRVFSAVKVVDSDTFQVYASNSLTVSSQTANVNTIIDDKRNFYNLKLNSISGTFKASGKTKLRKKVSTTDTDIFVDSTIGFSESGSVVIGGDSIQYTSKSINRFEGCTGISRSHKIGSELENNLRVTSYENEDPNKPTILRVVDISTNKLSNYDFILKNHTSLNIKSIGFSESNKFIDSFLYNQPIDFESSSIDVTTNRIEFRVAHNFVSGDKVDIKDFFIKNENGSRSFLYFEGINITVVSENSIEIGQPITNLIGKKIVVSKSLQTGSSSNIAGISNESANIDRIFIDSNDDYAVLSGSIPAYDITINSNSNSLSKQFTISLTGATELRVFTEFNSIRFNSSHGYKTGEKINLTLVGITTSVANDYYVRRMSDTELALALSASSADTNDRVKLDTLVDSVGGLNNSSTATFIKSEFYNRPVEHQKTIRYIKSDITEGSDYEDLKEIYNPTGILVNGLELYPPGGDETISYGRIESVDVLNGGKDFDLISPPVGIITNSYNGSQGRVDFKLEGTLQEILVTNGGSRIRKKPTIKILGGNHQDVSVEPVLVDEYPFKIFAPAKAVSLINDTITFNTDHKFETGDPVQYSIVGTGTSIGLIGGQSLVNNSIYYVIKDSSTVIKLANTKSDAHAGVELNLANVQGSGDHKLVSVEPQTILSRVDVVSGGKFTYNKIFTIPGSVGIYPPGINGEVTFHGINVSSNYFYINNHGFDNGTLIKFGSTDPSPTPYGLTKGSYYYVHKIDDNKFKLSEAGADLENLSRTDFDNQKFVDLQSNPTSDTSVFNIFSIPAIQFSVENTDADIVPQIKPIIRGSITSVNVRQPGNSYGSESLNVDRTPDIAIKRGSGLQVKLIIINGQVDSAFVISGGSGYTTAPDLIVNPGNSKGLFARLDPVVTGGVVTAVTVAQKGSNYDDSAFVTEVTPGSNQKFRVNLTKWRVNSVVKNLSSTLFDDHYLVPGKGNTTKVVSSYVPAKLRENFGDDINVVDSSLLSLTLKHSKILGWAFDGNPIYAQFGYTNPNTTAEGVSRLKSSYIRKPTAEINTQDTSGIRPSSSRYPSGYFVNDYYYDSTSGDLDEYNGRYCITPEYPGGIYAYFSVLDSNANPAFPYCMNGIHDKYDARNFNSIETNQKYLPNILNGLRSCTSPFLLGVSGAEYPFLEDPTEIPAVDIENQKKSKLSKINVSIPGTGFKVDDVITVANEEPFGKNAVAKVSSIKGVGITTITTTKTTNNSVSFQISNDIVTAITPSPHNFANRDNIRVIIAGVTDNDFTFLNETYPITVKTPTLVLVDDLSNTGSIAFVQVSEDITQINLNIDDQIQIGSEKMKVLTFEPSLNQIKVQRAVAGTSIASHSKSAEISILPSRFTFTTGIQTSANTPRYNKQYFNTGAVGVGSTQATTVTVTGVTTEISLNPQQIFIRNHNFGTNDKVVYDKGGVLGVALTVSNDVNMSTNYQLTDNQELYVVRYDDNIIGLSTIPVKIGAAYSDTNYDPGLYFPFAGANELNSITYNELPIGSAFELETVVNTGLSTHGLSVNDEVTIDIKPSETITQNIVYDNNLQLFKIDPIEIGETGISTVKNTLSLNNHNLNTGDRVIYNPVYSTTLGAGFTSGGIYYVHVFSENEFSLSETSGQLKKRNFLAITSGIATARLENINPRIDIAKGNRLTLTGISSLGVDISFNQLPYADSKKVDTSSFNYGTDSIEIDTSQIDNRSIYFFPILVDNSEEYTDEPSKIIINDSVYNGIFKVTGISSISFNIELDGNPEALSYTSANSTPSYVTKSKTAIGPVNDLKITNTGYSFVYPTGEVSETSGLGTDAKFTYELEKTDDGTDVVKKLKGLSDFSSDSTYSLNLDVPSLISVRSNNKIVDINIDDPGAGYIVPPRVKILNEPDFYTVVNLFGNTVGEVNIVSVDNGILSDKVTVFSELHTNGVEVLRAEVEADQTTIKLYIKEPNNGFISFPFVVGDEIYVEGLVVQPNKGTGFNSKDYDFRYFKVTAISNALGSAYVEYNISGLGSLTIGNDTFDSSKSFGRIIKKGDLAKFSAVLEASNYSPGEVVTTTNGYSATIDEDGWNPKSKTLSLIKQSGILRQDDILSGSQSGAKSRVNLIKNQEVSVIRDSITENDIFDQEAIASKLNEESQVISDNFYYQTFSYDVATKVPLNTWDSIVSNVNHLSGFEKFGTLVVDGDSLTGAAVSSTEADSTSTILILPTEMDMETTFTFDLAKENVIDTGNFILSNEITFNSRKITDSLVSITNEVILIDDISPEFDGVYDADDGGQFVGLSSFRLTTSETGITTSLFVKTFDASESTVVNTTDDKIYIPKHNFSTGEQLNLVYNTGTPISIASTDRVVGGVSTTLMPETVFAINLDDDHIQLAGLSTDSKNSRPFNLTGVGTAIQTLKSTNQNTRCLLLLDGIIQTPLSFSDINVSLGSSVGIASTTITLTGITSVFSNTLIEMDSELVRVNVVGFGSTNVFTVDRGVMGTVAAAHTVGAALTIRKGQYIIRDDVVFFDSPPLSGVTTEFNFNTTGIPTSFNRYRFHGRVFNRLSYDRNKIFDDISERFDGSSSMFELLENGQSVEDMFETQTGILTGTDVSSGVILVNNIFQVPNSIDYSIIENVGVGASVQFAGSNDQTLPSGGQITEYNVNRGAGYQQLTAAAGSISSTSQLSVLGTITGVTLTERGSGYTADMPVHISISNVGTGADITALVGTGSYTGNNVSVQTFTYDHTIGIATVVTSSAHGLVAAELPDVIITGVAASIFPGDTTVSEQLHVIDIIDTTTFEVGIGTSSTAYTYSSGLDVYPGSNVGFITGFTITSGGSGYTSTTSLVPVIPSPSSYSNLSLTGGSGSGAKGDLVILGAGGTTFTFNLIELGIGYNQNDVLSITGIPTSPYTTTFSDFTLTVDRVNRDSFSGYTFGEFVLFDDVSSFANGSVINFKLTRTNNGVKSLVSLDTLDGSPINVANNLLIFVNDVLQIPGESYTFSGGTSITFNEPPKTGAKITIMFFKGSSEDMLELDVLSTVKEGDLLQLDRFYPKNLDQELERTVFEILSSDTVLTNNYSNIGLGTDPDLLRSCDWTKQRKDITVNGDIIYKTRPELVTKPIPNANIIKNVSTTDTEIFTDSSTLFQIDSKAESDNDLLLFNTSVGNPLQATATLAVDQNGRLESISLGSSGSGYASAPQVSIYSTVTQVRVPGISWTNVGLDTTYTLNSVDHIDLNNKYFVVGDSGFVGYTTVNVGVTSVVKNTVGYGFTQDLNSVTHGYRNSELFISFVGDGIVGYGTTVDGSFTGVTSAFPPVVGGIVGSSALNPNTKVSIESINFNDVVYFDNIQTSVAVGGTIMVNAPTLGVGTDWQMMNIDSTLGGPEGQDLQKVFYYPRQDKEGINPNAPVSAGYIAIGKTAYAFKSNDGIKWNQSGTTKSFRITALPSEATGKDFTGISGNNDELVIVGTSGFIMRATTLKSNTNAFTYVGITTTEDFADVVYSGVSSAFVAITTSGNTYVSVAGTSWTKQTSDLYSVGSGTTITDLFYNQSINRLAAVGATSAESIFTDSVPEEIPATATATVNGDGNVSGITLTNSGFGFDTSNPPIIQIAPPTRVYENIENVKWEGDFGQVVSISTVVGINTDWALQFELDCDPILSSTLYSAFNKSVSGLTTGYYFSITGSAYTTTTNPFASVDAGLTTITNSKDFNKIYRVTGIVTSTAGIVTVTSDIESTSAIITDVSTVLDNASGVSTNHTHVASYGWGRIYDFDRPAPKSFNIKVGMGTVGDGFNGVGLSSNPVVIRKQQINENY